MEVLKTVEELNQETNREMAEFFNDYAKGLRANTAPVKSSLINAMTAYMRLNNIGDTSDGDQLERRVQRHLGVPRPRLIPGEPDPFSDDTEEIVWRES